jgi:hypothetical protein
LKLEENRLLEPGFFKCPQALKCLRASIKSGRQHAHFYSFVGMFEEI